MADNVVIRFQYLGHDTDVVVKEIDMVNLLDLIIEYWDNCEKESKPTPTYPSFTYLFKMNHIEIKTDLDLVRMFENLGRELIFIWVQSVNKPTKVVQAALTLRASQAKNIPPKPTTAHEPKPKTPTKTTPQPIQVPDVFLCDEEGRMIGNLEMQNDFEITPVEQNKGRGRGRGGGTMRGRGRGKGKAREAHDVIIQSQPESLFQTQHEVHTTPHSPVSNQNQTLPCAPTAVPNHIQPQMSMHSSTRPGIFNDQTPSIPSTFEAGESSGNAISSPMIKKRIPKTTAKRKGLKVQAPQMSQKASNTDSEPSRRTLSITRLGVDGEYNSDEPDSDFIVDEFDPQTDSEDESVDDEDMNLSLDSMEMIQDDFDPFDGPVWDDTTDDFDCYLAKLYKNGEFYENVEFGKIQLKPWQLFVDKHHLKDTIRDFCIQSGFSVVVVRATNHRYTIICSDERCAWRLHASILPDGITWAIKSIQNPEHTCLGLENRNSMVTAKWACRVLLEDIRANNNIPGKALNELLWQRYKVNMAQSTLYKMKTEALMEIHGGHDLSYSYLPTYCRVIMETNPQSTAICSWNPANHPEKPLSFSTIFISFKACLDGLFAGCRGVIGVDGAHLKGNYGGVLLSAIALDGNNEMFPVAWGIVSSEDEENWKFFIWQLKRVLEPSGRGNNWCFISDRNLVR